jgi:hypothetical protein
MRNTRRLRYSLAAALTASVALGATLVACGDDDDVGPGGTTTPVPEASITETSTGSDSATEAGKVDAGAPAKLTLINALTDLGPNATINSAQTAMIRVCFKQGTTEQNVSVAPYPPLPDSQPSKTLPGINYGTGGTFPSFGLDLEPRVIVPIIMNAKTLAAKGILNPGTGAPGTTCDELVGTSKDAAIGLEANKDYWELPAIPAGSFKKEASYVLLLTGCVADADQVITAGGKKCGDGFTYNAAGGTGNMKVSILETTRTPVSATTHGIQFTNASAQANFLFGAAGIADAYRPGFVATVADGGNYRSVTDGGAPGYLTLTPAAAFTINDGDSFVAGPTDPMSPPAAWIPYPLPFVQALSGLGAPQAPTVYVAGKNYVFIAVGDPDSTSTPTFIQSNGSAGDGGDGSQYNTKFFHFLAFPTDPAVTGYTP